MIVDITAIVPIIGGKFNMNSWNSKFSDGLQQFIAIRKNNATKNNSEIYYDVEPLTSTSAVDAPYNLIFGRESGDYRRVIGFSGTVGNKREKERMEKTLKMKSLSYPAHEEMPKVGLFEKEDYDFLARTSRTRFDKYVLLTRSDEEKVARLINVIIHTIKGGKTDPFLILCNNHQAVYKYQEMLARKISSSRSLRNAITGIQTLGLGPMKSYNSKTAIMSSKDEENYLALRKQLGIEDEGDRQKKLHERIIDQAAFAGVITFGTIGNNARGTDVKNDKANPRELNTIIFGCNKEALTLSGLIQGLGRTFGRFAGRAGVIVTIDEVLNELKEFNVTIKPTKIIVQHFYKLLNLIASNNTKASDRNRVLNVIWEVIQNALHKKITNQDEASKRASTLTILSQDIYQEWTIANKKDRTYPIFIETALRILNENLPPDEVSEINKALEAEASNHDFTEVNIETEKFLDPAQQLDTNPIRLRGLTYTTFGNRFFTSSFFQLVVILTPICLGKFICSTMMWTSPIPGLLTPIISGTLHGFLFQYNDSLDNDKAEKLRIWHYDSQLALSSTIVGTAVGILSATQQQAFHQLIQIGSTALAEHTSFKFINIAVGSAYIITTGITCASAIATYTWLRNKALDSLDSKAIYNQPPEIEIM